MCQSKAQRMYIGCVVAGLLGAAASPALGVSGTVLLIVNNTASLDAQETLKRNLFLGWGYTVATLNSTATQAQYDTALLTASVVYVPETITSTDVGTKLLNATQGVIIEEPALSDEFGISTTYTNINVQNTTITNGTHYITSTLGAGTFNVFNSIQATRVLSGTLGGFTTLATQFGGSAPMFGIMERGSTLTPSGTAAGRRVYPAWGHSTFDTASFSTQGLTLLQRSIEWCLRPVAHWKLDDASGSTCVDWIGGYNGTRTGTTWTTGRIAGGLSFNGSTDYVEVANNAAFQVTNALTIAGWVRASVWSTSTWVSPILRKGDANPNNWQLAITNGRIEMGLDANDDNGIKGNTTLSTNTWHHVAGTWDGVNARVYLNGVLDNTPTARAAPILTDTRPVYLGGRIGNTDIINGVVDDVRFYNRALTAAEVAELAKATPVVKTWTQVNPN